MVRDSARRGNKKILLVMPTGSGKTHVLAAIAEGSVGKGNKILASMHRRQLVKQMHDSFVESGLSPAIIMAGIDHDLSCQVQIVSLATYARRLKLCDNDINKFFIDAAVILLDEAHHALNPTNQQMLSNYQNKIVIGVTATPCLSSNVGMGQYFEDIVQPVSIGGLVDAGFLVPGIYYGPDTPDLSNIRTVLGDYEKKALGEVMEKPALIGSVVQNWLKLAGNKKTMVFAVNVAHSKALAREFVAHGVEAEHLDAHHDDDERSATLGRFRMGATQVLCNVALYTEGTDIPEIECIDIARPTKSLGLHLQIIGRGARPFPGKQNFIVIDHGGNIERLGFYEDEITWGLDGKRPAAKKKIKRVKEKKLLTCSECCHVFEARQRCPQCFTPVGDYGKKIAEAEADLVELGKKRPKATRDEKQAFLDMAEYHRKQKNYKKGWEAWQYRARFSVWPRGLVATPRPPSIEFLRYMQYQQIRSAKRREKEPKQLTLG
jgi:superfamily II DNA or RNA helicase